MCRRFFHIAGQNIKFCSADEQIKIFEHLLSRFCSDKSGGLEIQPLDDFPACRDPDGVFLSPLNKDYRSERTALVERDSAAAGKRSPADEQPVLKNSHDRLVVVQNVYFIAEFFEPKSGVSGFAYSRFRGKRYALPPQTSAEE